MVCNFLYLQVTIRFISSLPMKKWNKFHLVGVTRFLLPAFCLLLLTFSRFASAISIEDLTSAIDKATIKKGSITNQISFLKSLQSVLQTPEFTNSIYKDIFVELERYTNEKMVKLQSTSANTSAASSTNTRPTSTHSTVKKSDGTNYINLPDVDSQKIKTTLLQRHNQERANVGASPYAYHSELEKSAQTRADYLNRKSITSNTHQRNPGDGYYSYESISNRFGDLWIFFPAAWWGKASFSESVGRGYYTCKSGNCTDELIKQLKTTRDFFMSEKKSNGSHYRAITMGHFTQMGIGVSIDSAQKRYYLVVHYGMEVME